jgi:hypothetical protein
MDTGELQGRWRDLDFLLLRQGNIVGPGFDPTPEVLYLLTVGFRAHCFGFVLLISALRSKPASQQ